MIKNYPNLFIPGAAKSGTSSLHELLNLHPDICMSSEKEPFFWVNQAFSSYTNKNWNNYLSLFKEKPNSKYKGESSTSYMLFPSFLERIKDLKIENLKFIFVLRNPVDRIYSHYWYLKGLGSEDKSLREAILSDFNEEPDITKCLPEGKYKHYFQYGLYGKWLSKFYKNFNSNQIKIVIFEDLVKYPSIITNDCFRFLGLNELDIIPNIQYNETVVLKHPKLYQNVIIFTNKIKEILRPSFKYFPGFLKKPIKKIDLSKIIIKSTKSNEVIPKISKIDRDWLADLYQNDISLLKSITGLNFNQWTDFKT